jgi:hypothetical protein
LTVRETKKQGTNKIGKRKRVRKEGRKKILGRDESWKKKR